MKTTLTLFIILLLFSVQFISAQEIEKVKVVNLRKSVTATVNGETKTPLLDEELPLDTKIETNKMGLIEFEYKGKTYKISENTNVLLSDAVKQNGKENYRADSKTNVSGSRGGDVKRSKNKKTKSKKIIEEDK